MSVNDLGAVPASSTIYLYWTSHDLATGANETMSGLAVGDIGVYKNGSITQRASTTGFTLLDTDGIDFDGLTGVNGISIDLSSDADAGFYAVGSSYVVILGPITIDAQTVYVNLGSFRIVAAEAITGKPKVDVDGWLGTAAATPTVAGVPEVDLTHVAGATTNVSALATNVDAILTDTADMQPKLGTPAGASISADIAAIEAQTDDIGVAGAGLTAVPWNATWDAEVESEVADALEATIDDSIPADGSRPSVKQGIYLLTQFMLERGVSGTTLTVYKPDGTTALLTLTLDDATTPTAITRAT